MSPGATVPAVSYCLHSPGTYLCPAGTHWCDDSSNNVLGIVMAEVQSIEGAKRSSSSIVDPSTNHRYLLHTGEVAVEYAVGQLPPGTDWWLLH